MPLVITVISSECVSSGKKRPDGHRRFRLSHENAGGDVQRFGTAGAHHARHHPGEDADNDLHDSEVVEDREKCADENDGWQYLKGEIETEMRILFPQVAENKLRTHIRVAQQTTDSVASLLENPPPGVDPQHKHGKHKLQTQSPRDSFQRIARRLVENA